MKSFRILPASLLVAAAALAPAAGAFTDVHSFANPDEVRIRHVDLDLTVDFDARVLSGHADLTIERVDPDADELVLDTRALSIRSVTTAGSGGAGQALEFELGPETPPLGAALRIRLPDEGDVVRVTYATSPEASGLQWLTPAQTAGKRRPFLFTQSQAIHARSWIPLQDTPQVRVTYTARIRTPKDLLAVMSAENEPGTPRDGDYAFEMPQAIPSYLIALGVGDLEFRAMGERTGVYAEPSLVSAAAEEFADTEKMLETVEKLYGPYRWGRYDLLILPPSFPFGGMENPRLSFITPTVIAGDKSLVALIAHELAHSWSGNLVTNATWRDLWLNEGFTSYLTSRIMEVVYGPRRAAMEDVLEYQSLQRDLADLDDADEALTADFKGRDPDQVFSEVPYVKGMLFVKRLELAYGRERFDDFLQRYFDHFAFQSVTTEQFLEFLRANLPKDGISDAEIAQWVREPGLPPTVPVPESDAFTRVAEAQKQWLDGGKAADLPTGSWTVHEWLYFLNTLPEQIARVRLEELDGEFNLSTTRNSEIAHSWFLVAIRNDYEPAFPSLRAYLERIGRRKLIKPLYEALMKTPKGSEFARAVYERARPGYHPLTVSTIDAIVLAGPQAGQP
jgi:aminopeptidase N